MNMDFKSRNDRWRLVTLRTRVKFIVGSSSKFFDPFILSLLKGFADVELIFLCAMCEEYIMG